MNTANYKIDKKGDPRKWIGNDDRIQERGNMEQMLVGAWNGDRAWSSGRWYQIWSEHIIAPTIHIGRCILTSILSYNNRRKYVIIN